jgi:putative CocE/NonD family hydrolase
MYVMGRNEWHYANEWPLPGTQNRNLYFGHDFGLSFDKDAESGADAFTYDPENPVPSRGGRIIHAGGQYEQSDIEARDDVLCYTTAPLESDLEVIGAVSASIRASSTAAIADVAVKLVDVHPDGKAYNVIDSIARGAFKPGETTFLEFRVDVTAYAFPKGHRIRIEIAGSCAPHYDKAEKPATTRLYRGGENASFIVLPVATAR